MKSLSVARAQSQSVISQPRTIQGVKVYPCSYGHIMWLVDRKNKVLNQKPDAGDFDLAEVCYAFTHDPEKIQAIKGAKANTEIKGLLMRSSAACLNALFTYSCEQIAIHFKTLSSPKKAQQQAQNRRPAGHARKR